MNLESCLQLIIFLTLFGALNFVILLRRHEKKQEYKKNSQLQKIKHLYPKGTFIIS